MNNETKAAQRIQEKAEKFNITKTKASQFMTGQPVMARKGDKISSVIKTFKAHFIHGLPVVDHSFRLMGVVSEHDLILQMATKDFDDEISYTEKVIAITPETTLEETIILMFKKKLKMVPVIDDTTSMRVCGVVTRRDIIKFMASKHEEILRPEKN